MGHTQKQTGELYAERHFPMAPIPRVAYMSMIGGYLGGTENLLWLPPDRRPSCVAVHGKLAALGHAFSRINVEIHFFGFSHFCG
jgi:hypothetical protein